MSIWDKCIKLMEPLSEYIPDRGKADTIGGEMTRAVNCIAYRWFNDGDNVGSFDVYDNSRGWEHRISDYDIPSVTLAAAYIIDEYSSFGSLGRKLKQVVEELVYNDYTNPAYELCIVRLCQVARDIFDMSPEIFSKRNSDDMFDHDVTAKKIIDRVYTSWLPEED